MPKAPEEINYAARLRQLRLLMGQDYKPLDGDKFARLAGIPPGTLRSIESNLRYLGPENTARIRDRIGAVWSDRLGTWVFRDNEEIPFSRQLYEQYVTLLFDSPSMTEVNAEMLYQGVFELLSGLPKRSYHHALFELHDVLAKLASDYQAGAAACAAIWALRPEVGAEKNASGEVELNSIDYPNRKKILRPAPLLRDKAKLANVASWKQPAAEQSSRRSKGKGSKTRSPVPS